MGFEIRSRLVGGSASDVVLSGRLHGDGAANLRTVVDETIAGGRSLRFDVRDLESIDAAALAIIVDAVRRLRPRGGEVTFVGMRPVVRRLFELTRLRALVTIEADGDDATRRMT